MGFEERSAASRRFAALLKESVWDSPGVRARAHLAEYGYESHIADGDRRLISQSSGATARLIRFAPDFLLVNQQDPERLHFLEYKVTQTAVWSTRRLSELSAEAEQELVAEDVGQMEAAAFDTYCALGQAGARVAVAVWCPFHSRPLLCEWIEGVEEFHRDVVTTDTGTGSMTPYINYDMSKLRTLREFLIAEHDVAPEVSEWACVAAAERLRDELPPA